MSEPVRIKLEIAGQEFGLKVKEGDVEQLKEVANEVTERIEQLQKSGIGSSQRAAIMSAFQFAFEAKEMKGQSKSDPKRTKDVAKRLKDMISRIDQAIE